MRTGRLLAPLELHAQTRKQLQSILNSRSLPHALVRGLRRFRWCPTDGPTTPLPAPCWGLPVRPGGLLAPDPGEQ